MARLIDADRLLCDPYFQEDRWPESHLIRMAVREQRTVDAVPVVHGGWKYFHKQNIAVCTNCSFERNLDDNFGKAVSCPNCGATMDLGVNNV